eukprot:11448535-Karenia_brevis.AAC.1
MRQKEFGGVPPWPLSKDKAVDQQWHDGYQLQRGDEEQSGRRFGVENEFLMSSYCEQSGRRFGVEDERVYSHKPSLGPQEDGG